jgi:hypothetical protein
MTQDSHSTKSDARLREIAKKHAHAACNPTNALDKVSAQEEFRCQEVIFYALKDAAVIHHGDSGSISHLRKFEVYLAQKTERGAPIELSNMERLDLLAALRRVCDTPSSTEFGDEMRAKGFAEPPSRVEREGYVSSASRERDDGPQLEAQEVAERWNHAVEECAKVCDGFNKLEHVAEAIRTLKSATPPEAKEPKP